MIYSVPSWLLCLALTALLVATVEIGFRAGLRRRARTTEPGMGLGATEGAVFGLFGLLLALTFSHVVTRADARRLLVVDESNAIGTAFLRCDVLPDPLREQLRGKIRSYVDQRIADVEAGTDAARAAEASRRAIALQGEIWAGAAGLVRERPDVVGYTILLEALNEMIDLQTARDAAMRAHMQPIILCFLTITALGAAIVAGYALGLTGQMHRIASLCFVLLTALVAYTIIDIDRPRRGFFKPPIGVLLELRDAIRDGAP